MGPQMGTRLQGRGPGLHPMGATLPAPIALLILLRVPHSVQEPPDGHTGACVAPGGCGTHLGRRGHLPQGWKWHPPEVGFPGAAKRPCAISMSPPRTIAKWPCCCWRKKRTHSGSSRASCWGGNTQQALVTGWRCGKPREMAPSPTHPDPGGCRHSRSTVGSEKLPALKGT